MARADDVVEGDPAATALILQLAVGRVLVDGGRPLHRQPNQQERVIPVHIDAGAVNLRPLRDDADGGR